MRPIEAVKREIEHALPAVETTLRRPRNERGTWWLDAQDDGHVVTVQWSPQRGFGVSASALMDGYGEGPEEVLEDHETTAKRVIELLATKDYTVPPHDVLLRELRGLLGFTQEQLAAKLGVQQAAVSRLERRSDITLGSLRRYVAALGGELEINIRTPAGGHVRLLDQPGQRTTRRANCAHIDEAFSSVCPTSPEPSTSELRSWLETFESAVRARWQLCAPSLEVYYSAMPGLASADSAGGIAINAAAGLKLSQRLGQIACSSELPEAKANASCGAIFRYLLAHEVGHFVEGESLRNDPAFKHYDEHLELRADAIAGWLAGQMGDASILGSAITSLLGCRVRGCTHPTPEERSLAYLSGHAEGAQARYASARINLLVIRASDVERSRAFYSALGLHFVLERHGTGPLHYSSTLGGTLIELYPYTRRSDSPRGDLRIGFQLPSASTAIDGLVSSGFLRERPEPTRTQLRSKVYLIRDPDGNAIELEVPAA